MAFSRRLGSLALLLAGVESARIARKRGSEATTKFIAGIPVLNYHTAYGGRASLGELEGEEGQDWLVMVKPGTSDAEIQGMCTASNNGCKLVGHPKGGVPFLEFHASSERDLEAVLHSGKDVVKYVEPDNEVFLMPEMEPDVNDVSVAAATWGLFKIGANTRARAGAGATVFVLDTGVRVTHQEFGSRATPGLDVTVGDPLECNGDVSCAADRRGHGTHCAGTAVGQNYGVAPSAKVESVKVLSDAGGGSWSGIIYGLDWVAMNTVRPAVASMSLGGGGNLQSLADAVDSAVNAGVTVVVAAGNWNSDACSYSPAFVPSAITVGSTMSTDARSSFSNYGACTNIWAPGSNIISAGHSYDTHTQAKSGTSMACPHVAGAAALVLEADPTKKASAVLQELLDTAAVDKVSGLTALDANALLWVGRDPPPPWW